MKAFKNLISGIFLVGILSVLLAVPAAFAGRPKTTETLALIGLGLIATALVAALVMVMRQSRKQIANNQNTETTGEIAVTIMQILLEAFTYLP